MNVNPTSTANDVFAGRKPFGRSPKIAFIYDADGENWQSRAAELLRSLPGLPPHWKPSMRRFSASTGGVPLVESEVVDNGRPHGRTGLLALQLALTSWWRSVGVTPDVVLGFGTGELAAACAAGILSVEKQLGLIAKAAAGVWPRNPLQSTRTALERHSTHGPLAVSFLRRWPDT